MAICSKWSCPLSYQLWLMGPDGHIPLGSISTNVFRNSLVARNRNQLRESYESKLSTKNMDRKDKRPYEEMELKKEAIVNQSSYFRFFLSLSGAMKFFHCSAAFLSLLLKYLHSNHLKHLLKIQRPASLGMQPRKPHF